MKDRRRIAFGFLAVLCVAALLAAWRGFFGCPIIEVTNDSGKPLRWVRVESRDSKWSKLVDVIRPGEKVSFIPGKVTDGPVAVRFVAEMQFFGREAPAYFESSGGYLQKFSIGPDFSFASTGGGIGKFAWARFTYLLSPRPLRERFDSQKCEAIGGRVDSGRTVAKTVNFEGTPIRTITAEPNCKDPEFSAGFVDGMKCSCFCCVPRNGPSSEK